MPPRKASPVFNDEKLSDHTRKLIRAARGESITKQQDAVLELLLMGFTNLQIAMRLQTSEQVVKNSVHYLFARYNAASRAHLVIKILTRRHTEKLKSLQARLDECTCNQVVQRSMNAEYQQQR